MKSPRTITFKRTLKTKESNCIFVSLKYQNNKFNTLPEFPMSSMINAICF